MNSNTFPEFKLALTNAAEINQAFIALKQIGYSCKFECIATGYLYGDANGDVSLDSDESTLDMAVDGALAAEQFNKHSHPEMSLEDLLNTAAHYKQLADEALQARKDLIAIELPLFKASFKDANEVLKYLNWHFKEDGHGEFIVDWSAVDSDEINSIWLEENIQEQAHMVTSCFDSWLLCAVEKSIPEGFEVVPEKLSENQLKKLQFALGPDPFSVNPLSQKTYGMLIRIVTNKAA